MPPGTLCRAAYDGYHDAPLHGFFCRKPNIITSLELKPEVMEARNLHLQAKYKEIREKEVRYETLYADDAEVLIVAFGSAARLTQKAIEMAREEGIRVGLLRPITLWPFPTQAIADAARGKKGVLGGKDLRRRHECCLISVLCCCYHGKKSYNGLSAACIPL